MRTFVHSFCSLTWYAASNGSSRSPPPFSCWEFFSDPFFRGRSQTGEWSSTTYMRAKQADRSRHRFFIFHFRFGRKPVIFATMAFQAVATIIQMFSNSWIMFCILFFITGFGRVSSYVSAFVLGMFDHVTLNDGFIR